MCFFGLFWCGVGSCCIGGWLLLCVVCLFYVEK